MGPEGTQWNSQHFVLCVVLPAQEGQPAATAHHGGDACKRSAWIIEKHDAEGTYYYIARIRAERARLSITLYESGAGYTCLRRELPRNPEHWRGQI
jgi:hypothetical protein